jgi:hypothetical protein
MPRLHLHAVDDAEDIGRQPFNALKFHAPLPQKFSKTNSFSPIYKASFSLVQLNR